MTAPHRPHGLTLTEAVTMSREMAAESLFDVGPTAGSSISWDLDLDDGRMVTTTLRRLVDNGVIELSTWLVDDAGAHLYDPRDLPATARRAEAQPATRAPSRGRLLARTLLGSLLWAGAVTALAGTPAVRDDLALVLLGVLISLGALMGLVELEAGQP